MSGSQDKLNWTRKEPIAVPSPDKEERIAIRRSDWRRCRRDIKNLTRSPSTLTVWYSIFFGIAATAGFSIVPIYAADLAGWVCPFYVCVTVAACVLAVVILKVDRWLKKQGRSQATDIDLDMEEIEDSFTSLPAQKQGETLDS